MKSNRGCLRLSIVALAIGCGGADSGAPVDGGATSELPCAVASLLSTHCQSCHGTSPSNGAPMALMSRDSLLKMSRNDPSKTMAQESVARMSDSVRPMPPRPSVAVPASEQSAFAQWVSAGAPAGSCAN